METSVNFVLKIWKPLGALEKGRHYSREDRKSYSFVYLLCAEPLVILMKRVSVSDTPGAERVVSVLKAFAWPMICILL